MRWIIGIVVVAAVVALAWMFRGSFMDLFAPAPEPAPVAQEPAAKTYATSTGGYSFEYPAAYALNEAYVYPFGETKSISGVAVSAPAMAGTNLSQARLSVEQLPRAATCTADIFILDDVAASALTDNGTQYSFATTSGAGAGNVYEESVYALPGSSPCTAVRYYIHSTNVGNAEPGTVTEFDRAKLLAELDQIRRSLKLHQSAPSEE